MTQTDAIKSLEDNYEAIRLAYDIKFGVTSGMPNARVESVVDYSDQVVVLISCHFDGYDDYDDDCDDPDCNGTCEICDMKDSWSFELHINKDGSFRVC